MRRFTVTLDLWFLSGLLKQAEVPPCTYFLIATSTAPCHWKRPFSVIGARNLCLGRINLLQQKTAPGVKELFLVLSMTIMHMLWAAIQAMPDCSEQPKRSIPWWTCCEAIFLGRDQIISNRKRSGNFSPYRALWKAAHGLWVGILRLLKIPVQENTFQRKVWGISVLQVHQYG